MPTRNRPELLRYALSSIANQTFRDFEVIVCDNHTGKPAKDTFDDIADDRFHYITPPSPLSMSDNWEFASKYATGEYVSVLIDKVCLRPSALETMHEVLSRHPADIINWRNDAYRPVNESQGYDHGKIVSWWNKVEQAFYFDCKHELARRFSFDIRRGTEGERYCWGKICFGAYSKALIHRIREATGKLFHPIAPDYTSMVAALYFANSALDVGEPLVVDLHTSVSNGLNYALDIEHAKAFVASVDPELSILDDFPLAGIYGSHHNLVAHDYVTMAARVSGDPELLKLNTRNLILRVEEDLKNRQWNGQERSRDEQFEIWHRYYDQLSLTDKASLLLQSNSTKVKATKILLSDVLDECPSVKATLKKMLIGTGLVRPSAPGDRREFETVKDALVHLDRYYGDIKKKRAEVAS